MLLHNLYFNLSNNILYIILSFFTIILFQTILPWIRSKLLYPYTIQCILLGIPLYLPTILINYFSKSIALKNQISFLTVLLSISLIVLLLFFNLKDIKNNLNSPISKCKLPFKVGLTYIFETFFFVIGEEFYYRNFLFLISVYHPFIFIILSAFLFSYSHYVNRWANKNFNTRSYVSLLTLGIILASTYFFTSSLLLCIFLHLLYDSIRIFIILKRIFIKKEQINFDDY